MTELLQLLVNGIIAGSAYALLAIGFWMIYGTTRTFHFAHGGVYTLGGYVLYECIAGFGLPFIVGLVAVLAATGLLGMAIERFVYRPLRAVGASDMETLLSSLGLYVLIENVVIIVWRSDPRLVPTAERLQQGINVGGVWITGLQLVGLVASLAIWGAVFAFLRWTRPGKAIRALAADPEMTEVVGINEDRMRLAVYALGSMLAGCSVVLAAIDTGIAPVSGMNALLIATISVIVGGTAGVSGGVAGGFLIGIVENIGIWKIASEWKQAIAFGVLALFIVLRPMGLLGARQAR
ncbi:MAG: branched-chain amino acid ABC transporter permease [Candidatus Rokuibacteriota bacterium]